jgi:hypothetical protein
MPDLAALAALAALLRQVLSDHLGSSDAPEGPVRRRGETEEAW